MINLTRALSFSTLTGNSHPGVNTWLDGWRRRSVTRQTGGGGHTVRKHTHRCGGNHTEDGLIHVHHMSHCKHTWRMMGGEPAAAEESQQWCEMSTDLGSADYVWWMRIMWRLHSCTMRGLRDNSRNWTHRFHVCATWSDLIAVASGKWRWGRFEQHLAPCDSNWTSGTFLRQHVSRDVSEFWRNSNTPILSNSFWLIADANKSTENISKTYYWCSTNRRRCTMFFKVYSVSGKIKKTT